MLELFEHFLASEAVPICSYSPAHGHLAVASLDQRGHNNWNCFVWPPEAQAHCLSTFIEFVSVLLWVVFMVSLRPGFLWRTLPCMGRRSSDYPEAKSK